LDLSLYKVIRTKNITFNGNLFYDPKGQDIDYLLRDVLEDTILGNQSTGTLYKDKSNNKSILYQVVILKLNDSAKLFKKGY